MGISVDYDVFLDDAIKEFDRLKKVYNGEQADQDIPALHISDSAFLKYLNSTEVPLLQRILHGNAYDHMRALYRTLKVINFDREDFYKLAIEDMDKQKALYKEKQRLMSDTLEKIDNYILEDVKAKLEKADTISKQQKEDSENIVRADLKVPSDQAITKEIVIAHEKLKTGKL